MPNLVLNEPNPQPSVKLLNSRSVAPKFPVRASRREFRVIEFHGGGDSPVGRGAPQAATARLTRVTANSPTHGRRRVTTHSSSRRNKDPVLISSAFHLPSSLPSPCMSIIPSPFHLGSKFDRLSAFPRLRRAVSGHWSLAKRGRRN